MVKKDKKSTGGEYATLEEAFPETKVKKGGANSQLEKLIDSIMNNDKKEGGAKKSAKSRKSKGGEAPAVSQVPEHQSPPVMLPDTPLTPPVSPVTPPPTTGGAKKGKKNQKGGLIDMNITPFVTSLLLLGIRSAQQAGLGFKINNKLHKKLVKGGGELLGSEIEEVDVSNEESPSSFVAGGKKAKQSRKTKKSGGAEDETNFQEMFSSIVKGETPEVTEVTGGKVKKTRKSKKSKGGEGEEFANNTNEANTLMPKEEHFLTAVPNIIEEPKVGGKAKKSKKTGGNDFQSMLSSIIKGEKSGGAEEQFMTDAILGGAKKAKGRKARK